jgi:hypothetical protein
LDRFINNCFFHLIEFFGPEVRTGVIFRPRSDAPDWLYAWRANKGHELTSKTFYIGHDPGKDEDRGCAGEAYNSNMAIIYNMIDLRTGEGDVPCKKIFLEDEIGRHGPDYCSSLVVPIRWNMNPVGVLCIDSSEQDYFLIKDMEMTQFIAERIGDALYLHNELDWQIQVEQPKTGYR